MKQHCVPCDVDFWNEPLVYEVHQVQHAIKEGALIVGISLGSLSIVLVLLGFAGDL